MPVCGRTVGCELYSIVMMIGAPEAPIRAVDPADGTWTTVVKPRVQSAMARSCFRFVAVFGTSSVWVRLWLSVNASVAICPVAFQVMLRVSRAAPSRRTGVRAESIGWEKVTLRLPRKATACWPSARGASLKVAPATLCAEHQRGGHQHEDDGENPPAAL